MKKTILFFLLLFSISNLCSAQEWMASLDIAKRLALVQDKLVLMLWENATVEPYPVLVKSKNGIPVIQDLLGNEGFNEIIWEHFVPVIVNENKYPELYKQIKGKRTQSYIDKFNDDTIKVMDINGNIINVTLQYDMGYLDLANFIKTYAIDTSYLKAELTNYREKANFNTAYRLSTKYLDYAALVNDKLRPEIVILSNIYLKEASTYLLNERQENIEALEQKVELLKLKQFLLLNKPKKVLRQLKRIEPSEVDESNASLFAFLHFTSYGLLKDETNASVWRSKVSLVNLKKASLIINSNF
ncbi:hypothetical protein [uncultured Psychroserpens sp.]|uniref:hypothetical protein n=1 Tax=uncultured Psychroserpens sp. TaxID=255436 RepID=UPI0026179E11|nr:hypothetical protein [uncultured Psychroserpens sp.]